MSRSVGLVDQGRPQDDLVCGYPADAEPVQEALPVSEGEQVEGRPVVEGGSGVAVDVGHELCDAGLGQTVEGPALRQYHADELMVAFDAPLLPGGAGVAVKQA